MSLSHEEVRKVARLARLELDPAELERQTRSLNELLDIFGALRSVDVEGIEPTSHSVPVFNVMREDVSRPSLLVDEALRNAPESRDGYFIVPRIIEG